MAVVDKFCIAYHGDFMDFAIWCNRVKPSLLNNFYRETISRREWDEWQLKVDLETGKAYSKLQVAQFTEKQNKWLYWHCPFDFVREYLREQCGYKDANWFVKLFWIN